jgi:aminoglycoside 6-adenylyltransferase
MTKNEIISRLESFGNADKSIRAVILEGSQSTGKFTDDLSDYDVNIFTNDAKVYMVNDQWLRQFGEVLIYQKEHFEIYGEIVPTRLAVFKDGSRIDFSFWPIEALMEMTGGGKFYESYRNGYTILVDKDGIAKNLPKPDGQGFQVGKPERDEFLQTLYDFWFEAYCVARALARGYLWHAKRIEASYIKDHLYRMILWEHQSRHGWAHDPLLHLDGKRLEQWAEPELLKDIAICFSAYSIEETWKSLDAIVELFNRMAKGMAVELGFEYPEKTNQEIMKFIEKLKNSNLATKGGRPTADTLLLK